MTAALASASARYACCEMLLAGVTTFLDMYYFEDDIAQVVKQAGMRAFLGETVVDFPSCNSPEPHGGLGYAERFIPKWLDDELITPMVAPHATDANSPEKIVEARRLAERYGVPMTMHVGEMEYEVSHFRDEYGKTPIAFLDSLGVLDERFVAVHCVLADDADIDMLARRRVPVVHCIGANTKSAKGVAPVKKMLERGVRVALGTDGPPQAATPWTCSRSSIFSPEVSQDREQGQVGLPRGRDRQAGHLRRGGGPGDGRQDRVDRAAKRRI